MHVFIMRTYPGLFLTESTMSECNLSTLHFCSLLGSSQRAFGAVAQVTSRVFLGEVDDAGPNQPTVLLGATTLPQFPQCSHSQGVSVVVRLGYPSSGVVS